MDFCLRQSPRAARARSGYADMLMAYGTDLSTYDVVRLCQSTFNGN